MQGIPAFRAPSGAFRVLRAAPIALDPRPPALEEVGPLPLSLFALPVPASDLAVRTRSPPLGQGGDPSAGELRNSQELSGQPLYSGRQAWRAAAGPRVFASLKMNTLLCSI